VNGKHRGEPRITEHQVLTAAYDVLGDGQGSEWHDNTEYTRGVADLIIEVVGLPEQIVDPGGEGRLPFVLGMIHTAHLLSD